jgi:hypothetical protein
MADVSISGKKWLPATRVLMGAAEHCLSEVKQCISSPSIAEIDEAGELQTPLFAMLDQYVPLLQVVMAKDWAHAVPEQVEARLRIPLQAARQGLLSALRAKLPKHLLERRAHVFFVGRPGPLNAIGDDITVSAHGNGV